MWVPSHLGLYWNERADDQAKEGAIQKGSLANIISLSAHEIIAIMKNKILKTNEINKTIFPKCPQHISSLVFKLKLNTWRTKFVKDLLCDCGSQMSIEHFILHCPSLEIKDIIKSEDTMDTILSNNNLLIKISERIAQSKIHHLI